VIQTSSSKHKSQRILQGQKDTDINDIGRKQAESLGRRLSKDKFDHIYSSDLSRALHTAEFITSHHTNTPFTVDKKLREQVLPTFLLLCTSKPTFSNRIWAT
jgi:2,3-bisphosphoglycerate-dependent phosphoglycerate mutase